MRNGLVHLRRVPVGFRQNQRRMGLPASRKRGIAMTPSPVYAGPSPAEEEARRYSLGEEIASSVSHGVGALLGIAGLVLLIVFGVKHGGGPRVIAAVMMGVPLISQVLLSSKSFVAASMQAKPFFRYEGL